MNERENALIYLGNTHDPAWAARRAPPAWPMPAESGGGYVLIPASSYQPPATTNNAGMLTGLLVGFLIGLVVYHVMLNKAEPEAED